MTYDKNDVWSKPAVKVETPCTGVCIIGSTSGYCVGCFRTLKEINDWDYSTTIERNLILNNCKEREQNAFSSIK